MLTSRSVFLLFIFVLCSSSPALAENPEARARRLMNALGCKACHSFEKSGSTLAPPLDRIGARLTFQQLQEKLTGHRNSKGKALMPSYATTAEEDLNGILQFLADHK